MQTQIDKKYYTPDISEFYIGFEYEIEDLHDNLVDRTYRSVIGNWIELNIVMDDWEHEYNNFANLYRVKYLDKEDVESLGFIEVDYNKILYTEYLYLETTKVFEKEDYKLYLRIENNPTTDINMVITVLDKVRCTNEDLTYKEVYLFKGCIKNKSELKVLLKQLNIE